MSGDSEDECPCVLTTPVAVLEEVSSRVEADCDMCFRGTAGLVLVVGVTSAGSLGCGRFLTVESNENFLFRGRGMGVFFGLALPSEASDLEGI